MPKRRKQYRQVGKIISLLSILTFFSGCAQEVERPNSGPACFGTEPFTISNIEVNQSQSSGSYQTSFLAINQKVFVDRTYVYQTLAEPYQGLPYILTANADKSSDPNDEQFISFTVNRPIKVYIALDTRLNVPTWLQTWNRTNNFITDTDITRRVYEKSIDSCQVTLGGNGGSSNTSMYTVIIEEDTNVTVPPNIEPPPPAPAAPVAINDIADTLQHTPITIDVLGNDLNIGDPGLATVLLPSGVTAQQGNVSVGNDNQITYTPPAGDFVGQDRFEYTVQYSDLPPTTAEVVISVICANCIDRTLTLSWNPNPTAEVVAGYRIYTGDGSAEPRTFFMDIAANRTGFNPNLPSMRFNTNTDFNLVSGQRICFSITAYNVVGESGYSAMTCSPVF